MTTGQWLNNRIKRQLNLGSWKSREIQFWLLRRWGGGRQDKERGGELRPYTPVILTVIDILLLFHPPPIFVNRMRRKLENPVVTY